jgi:hypothetical protein
VDFWERRLGLRRVDEWNNDGEHAVVLEAGPGGLLEFVSYTDGRTGVPSGLTIALELPSWAAVDAEYQRLVADAAADPPAAAGPPTVYPRGYYAFRLGDPNDVEVLIWSEAQSARGPATTTATPADRSHR